MSKLGKIDMSLDDEDANADWLHGQSNNFLIFKDDKEIGKVDLKKEEIVTSDSELEEYFYLLIDEGIGKGPVTLGSDLIDAMEKQNYEAKPVVAE